MRLAAVVLVALVGVAVTIVAAVRLVQTSRRSDAPRELVLGYLALMLVAGLASMLLLRVL